MDTISLLFNIFSILYLYVTKFMNFFHSFSKQANLKVADESQNRFETD